MRFNLICRIVACLAFCSGCKCFGQSKYRPKIAEFSHRTLYDYRTYSNSSEHGNSSSEVEEDEQIRLRLGIPLVMKDSKLLGLQLKYDVHNFAFDIDDPNNDLFNHIESRAFRSVGGRVLFQRSLDKKRSLTFLAGAEIKSDEFNWNVNTMNYYSSSSYQVKINESTEIGGGFIVAYTLGRMQAYPFFTYERKLNTRWTLDLALPKSAAMRFRASDKFYIIAKTEVKGWRYALHNSSLSPETPLTLRRADLNMGLTFEREIHDWLWMGLDVGMAKNLRYHLGEPGAPGRDALVDLNANNAAFINFGLFIVPPRKFFN